jgi:hypothetical protein
MTIHLRLYSILAIILSVTAAEGATIFSNFGGGNSYNTSAGNFSGNGQDLTTTDYAEADTFTPTVTSGFSSISIALSCYSASACPNQFTVDLDADNGGVPGTTIESFTVAGTSLGVLGINNAPTVLNSVLHPVLTNGTAYWITVLAPFSDSVVWNWNSTSDPSNEAISTDNGSTWTAPFSTPGAYSVSSQTVVTTPEPSTLWLVALTTLGLLCVRRQRA